MSVLLLIVGLLLFVSLVVVHEFGHYIAARRNGVEVEEFGIGFPPRAWTRKLKNGVLLSLNWLPLGGFVRLKGEHDADRSPGSYGAASLWGKTKIMLAGVGMNLLTAWLLLTLLAVLGIPRLVENQFSIKRDAHVVKQEVLVGYVEPGSPAEKIGLQPRDRILRISDPDSRELAVCQQSQFTKCPIRDVLHTANELPNETKKYAGQTTILLFARNGTEQTVRVTLRSKAEVEASLKTDNPKGYLGIIPTEFIIQRYTWSAPLEAAGIIAQFAKLTFLGIGHALGGLFSGNTAQATEQVSGPVGIVVLLKDGSLLGYQFVLMIIAVISLTLAIMNVLPIPALDGGRLFVTLLFRAIKKPLTKRKEEWIHGTGFALLMLLFVLITIVDVHRFL
jgi:regulator of sigma E protease